MESKIDLEEGTEVYVLGVKAEIYDLVPSNTAVVKVRMLEGRSEGIVVLAVLGQVERE